VRKLAGLCLHDAELIGFDEAFQAAGSFWSALASFVLQDGGRVHTLAYALADRVERGRPPEDSPFSKERPHWLHDEIAVRPEGGFVHRILFSDGGVMTVPFVAVHLATAKLSPIQGAA